MRAEGAVVGVDMGAGGDVLARIADHLAEFHHRGAGRDGGAGDLVAREQGLAPTSTRDVTISTLSAGLRRRSWLAVSDMAHHWMGERGDDAAEFGEPAEPAHQRIAGVGAAADVVADLVAVVGPERNVRIRPPAVAPAAFLVEERRDEGHHVGVAAEMVGLLKRAIGLRRDIAQMGEMDAVGKAPGDRGHVIRRIGAERARAEVRPFAGLSTAPRIEAMSSAEDTIRGSPRMSRGRVVGVHAEPHPEILGRRRASSRKRR